MERIKNKRTGAFPVFFSLLIVSLLIGLVGCTTADMPGFEARTSGFNEEGATADGIQKTVDANNQFALDLFRKVDDSSKNIFFSPYSIFSSGSIVYEGARGETAVEMKNVFHYPETETLRTSSATINNIINKGRKDYKLSVANALFADEGYPFLESYFQTVDQYYGGKVAYLDLQDTAKSVPLMNSWVEDRTNGKITDLVDPSSITGNTKMIIVNAIYFKADWVKQFQKKDTMDWDFKKNDGSTVKVKMMSRVKEARFNYSEDEKYQVVELPYKGDELSMLVILPKEGFDSSDIQLEEISSLKNDLQSREIPVRMPKFKFETEYGLTETLKEMGMPTAFSGNADFSGMTGNRELFIGDVVHMAYIDVNEEGTEAAAATKWNMEAKAAMMTEFVADHPFLFLIQDRQTGFVLFVGKVNDPTLG